MRNGNTDGDWDDTADGTDNTLYYLYDGNLNVTGLPAGVEFDYVVTVCDCAHEACPAFPPTARVVHVGFDDPGTLARSAATEEEAMGHYRRVRDEIRALVESLPGRLREAGAPPQTKRPGS